MPKRSAPFFRLGDACWLGYGGQGEVLFHDLGKDFGLPVRQDGGVGGSAQGRNQSGVIQQAENSVREGVSVIVGIQQTGDALGEQVGVALDRGSHHREGGVHGLHDVEGKPFRAAGTDGAVGQPVQGSDRGHKTGEDYPIRNAQLSG